MKILLECTSITPGESCGVETFVYSLINGLNNCGYNDELFINIPPGTRDKYESVVDVNCVHIREDMWQKKFKDIYYNNLPLKVLFGILSRIGFRHSVEELFSLPRNKWANICDNDIDVVLYPFHKGINIRHLRKPVILVMHDLRDLDRNPDKFMPFYREQIHGCKAIVTSWPHPLQILKQYFPECADKFFMIPFLTEQIPPEGDIHCSPVPRLLIYPASNGIDKNHENLIISLGILKKNGIEPINIVCPGFQLESRAKQLNKLIKENGVDDWISFIGFVPRSHIKLLYKICSGVVSTTKYEAFSGAVLEGFVYGKPVACSRIPPLTCMIDSLDVKVKYFNPDDPVDIASSIMEIINNPSPYVMGSLVARKYLSDMTQEKTAIQYREVLKWAINR